MKLSELAFEEKIIGKGSYGSVQLATHIPTGTKVAVKKLDKASIKTPKLQETLNREIQIQKKLKHVNIVRLYANLEDDRFIYLILEYVEQGNLFFIIRKKAKLTEDEAFYFFIQTVAGIYFLHKNGFIHRDLKPENLLVGSDNVLKICDFGWCVQSGGQADHGGGGFEEQRNTFCGTLEYMAPEMIQERPHNHQLDVWSIGILLYELVHGRAPFRGNQLEIGREIVGGNVKFGPDCSEDYKDLVRKILVQDPDERLPLVKVFVHPWVLHF